MRSNFESRKNSVLLAVAGASFLLLHAFSASAATLSLATSPLASSTTSVVKPNLMFILDNSGSMGWEYMPDSVNGNNSKYCYRNSYYNRVYYNPDLTYLLPVDYLGDPFTAATFTSAWDDGFNTGSGTTNLSTSFQAGNDSTGQAAYYYKYTGATPATPVVGTCYPDTSYTKVTVSSTSGPGSTDERTNFANWYSFYRTRLLMMKTAAGLAFRGIGSNYRVGFTTISYTGTDSTNAGFLKINDFTSGATGYKKTWYDKLYNASGNSYTPLRGSLSKVGRMYAGQLLTGANDPVQYSCQQNFAILSTDGYWNNDTESTTYGPLGIDNTTHVGNMDGTASRAMYDGAISNWTLTYTRTFYSSSTSGCSGGKKRVKAQPQTGSCTVPTATDTCTPASWTNSGAATYLGSCSASVTLPSPNPTVLTQVGSATPSTSGGSIDSLADVAMYYYQTDLRTPTLGNCTGALASENVCTNNVFTTSSDNSTQQHLTLFTLGLGASGHMEYSPSYLTDTSGDFFSVKLGSAASSTVCTWQTSGTTCNWPIPSSGAVANIDDMWHAAVNGRGAYFSATDPTTLISSLTNALAGINARKGSAAAAATSTLSPVAGNNYAFVASYTTQKWQGNLEGRGINIDTGAVNENATWCVENVVAGTCAAPSTIEIDTSGATTTYYCVTPSSVTCAGGILDGTNCKIPVATSCTGTMNGKVSDASDSRTIYTANSTGTALTAFDTTYRAANSNYFDAAHISGLSQWSVLSAAQRSLAEGDNLINYLRGQYGYEKRLSNLAVNQLYRAREAVMGDALESQPAYVGAPVFQYSYTGYSAYASAQASRPGTVYMGTNDGMLHAFDSTNGNERWAYVPSMVVPNMWILADENYATLHRNFVNGSPAISDIYCPGNCGGVTDVSYGDSASWRTILVGGLNAGGRGYYALDITVPNSPTLLWEFTTTSGIGKIQDDDMGYGFATPIISRMSDGTWIVVVTSGYNNVSPGTGKGYLYVLNATTGTILKKISTGVGDTTTPSGLGKIAAWNHEVGGNLAGLLYGGDLQGNVWRFDINGLSVADVGTGEVLRFARLYSDAAGLSPQPITTAPELGQIGGKRIVFVGTGKYLETADLSSTQKQTVYAIKDDDETSTLVNPRNTLVSQTLGINPDGTATRITTSNNTVNFGTGRGWYVDLPDSGERVNINMMLISGVLVVPSIVPSNTACAPGGYGWLNLFNYKSGGSANTVASVKAHSPIVGVNLMYIDGKPKLSWVLVDNGTPTDTGLGIPSKPVGFQKSRVLWREMAK